MLNNNFAYELEIYLDIEHLTKIALDPNPMIEGILPHQRLAELDPYMTYLKTKFPFLSSMYNVYDCRPGINIPLHVDSARDCAFNIPITGTEDSHTIFYKYKETENSEFLPSRVYNVIKSSVEEDFRFTLRRPTLINNSVPHEVINGNHRRVIISWSVKKDYSFTEAKELFKKALSADAVISQ